MDDVHGEWETNGTRTGGKGRFGRGDVSRRSSSISVERPAVLLCSPAVSCSSPRRTVSPTVTRHLARLFHEIPRTKLRVKFTHDRVAGNNTLVDVPQGSPKTRRPKRHLTKRQRRSPVDRLYHYCINCTRFEPPGFFKTFLFLAVSLHRRRPSPPPPFERFHARVIRSYGAARRITPNLRHNNFEKDLNDQHISSIHRSHNIGRNIF